MKKITITEGQVQQFNRMYMALKRITKYDSTTKLRKQSEGNYGLEFDEAIEMSYENIQGEAKSAIARVKPILIPEGLALTHETKNENV